MSISALPYFSFVLTLICTCACTCVNRCTKREPPEETYSDVSVFGLQTIYVVVCQLFTITWNYIIV